MNWLARVFTCLLYIGFVSIGWWYVAVIIGVVLAYLVVPYELIAAGLMIDFLFYAVASGPWYFLIGLGLCFMSVVLVPYIRLSSPPGPLKI